MNNYDNLTIADLKVLANKTTHSRYRNIFCQNAIDIIERDLERFDLVMSVLKNADKPLRAMDISKNTEWSVQAISATLGKLVDCNIVRRVEVKGDPIEVKCSHSRWRKTEVDTMKFFPIGSIIKVTPTTTYFELAK